jgi:hypothetical protein
MLSDDVRKDLLVFLRCVALREAQDGADQAALQSAIDFVEHPFLGNGFGIPYLLFLWTCYLAVMCVLT